MTRSVCFACIAFTVTAGAAGCRATITADPADAIQAVMNAQVEAWNRGDIEGFLDGYLDSPDLLFASRGTFSRGWRPLLERYKRAYPEGKMGTLRFTDVEVHPIGSDAAWVSGAWWLNDGAAAPHGVFTLIFRRTHAGWKIVHDHSSGVPDSTLAHQGG
jgi:ketosteroid isomerase-like protein